MKSVEGMEKLFGATVLWGYYYVLDEYRTSVMESGHFYSANIVEQYLILNENFINLENARK